MKKNIIVFIMFLFILTSFQTTGNFFWVSTSNGTPTSIFVSVTIGTPNVNPPFPQTDTTVYDLLKLYTIYSTNKNSTSMLPQIEITGSGDIFGNIGSNSNSNSIIKLTGSIKIIGKIHVGLNSDLENVVKAFGSCAYGDIIILNSPIIFPAFAFPEFPNLENKGNVFYDNKKKQYEISQSGKFNNIVLSGNDSLRIAANDETISIILDKLDMNGSGDIIIESNSNVILYIVESFSATGSGKINKIKGNQTPNKLTIYNKGYTNLTGSGDISGIFITEKLNLSKTGSGNFFGHILVSNEPNINVTGSGNINGVLYAPNSNIYFTGSGNTCNIISKNFKQTGSGNIFNATSYIDNTDSNYKFINIFPFNLF